MEHADDDMKAQKKTPVLIAIAAKECREGRMKSMNLK